MLRYAFLFFKYFYTFFPLFGNLLKFRMFPYGHGFLVPPLLEIASYRKSINPNCLIYFIHLSHTHCRLSVWIFVQIQCIGMVIRNSEHQRQVFSIILKNAHISCPFFVEGRPEVPVVFCLFV